MRKLRTCLLLCGLAPLMCAAAAAQEISVVAPAARRGPPAREQSIRRFLKATRVVEREMGIIDMAVADMKRQAPQIPEKVWEEVTAEFKRVFNPEEIISVYVKIYSRRFNDREMQQMAAFFESPVGRRLVEEGPAINMEAFAAGAERGFNIADKIRELLKSKGFNVPVT
jgi:uncharacterized protein